MKTQIKILLFAIIVTFSIENGVFGQNSDSLTVYSNQLQLQLDSTYISKDVRMGLPAKTIKTNIFLKKSNRLVAEFVRVDEQRYYFTKYDNQGNDIETGEYIFDTIYSRVTHLQLPIFSQDPTGEKGIMTDYFCTGCDRKLWRNGYWIEIEKVGKNFRRIAGHYIFGQKNGIWEISKPAPNTQNLVSTGIDSIFDYDKNIVKSYRKLPERSNYIRQLLRGEWYHLEIKSETFILSKYSDTPDTNPDINFFTATTFESSNKLLSDPLVTGQWELDEDTLVLKSCGHTYSYSYCLDENSRLLLKATKK